MAPLVRFVRRAFDPDFPSTEFSVQFKNPTDVFSVLLILGGDVVARALAQLVGSPITPVAFSFGWVAYAVAAVVSAVGENTLMPPADFSCKVINGRNGFVRDNCSWIIGRVVRDFESWMDEQPLAKHVGGVSVTKAPIRTRVEEIINLSWNERKRRARERGKPEPERPPKAGLCVAIYRARKARKGHPGYDFPYITGCLTCVLQLGLAAIPCGLYGDWSILLVTAAGTALSFVSGAIPQWSKEKWACREGTDKTFVLTKGNGSQYAIVIEGDGVGLDLEDLAAVDGSAFTSYLTRLLVISLAVLWIILLVASAGISENTWFLFAVGGLGILQNAYVAGASRSPGAFGIPLEFVEVIAKPRVIDTLLAVEEQRPCLGKSMLPIFFTGELNDADKQRWVDCQDRIKKEKTRENEQA